MKRRSILGIFGLTPFALFARQSAKDNMLVQILSKRWAHSRDYSLAVLNAMPDELIEFSPSTEQLTFVQHLIHLSFFNNLFLGFMMDDPGFQDMKTFLNAKYLLKRPDNIDLFKNSKLSDRGGAANKSLVESYIKDTFEYVLDELNKIDDDFLSKESEKNKPWFLANHTNLDFILRGENHTAHHRAQAISYLRMSEVKPPSYAKFNTL